VVNLESAEGCPHIHQPALQGNARVSHFYRKRFALSGNYPTRRVYRITQEGLDAFQQLLRKSLTNYRPVSYLNSIGIVFLDTLPEEEAAALLRQRREEVESLAEILRADEQHQGGFQLMLSYHLGQLNAELEWLDEVIGHLQKA
jgi:DNA-binding PadR family transcriptional regulator